MTQRPRALARIATAVAIFATAAVGVLELLYLFVGDRTWWGEALCIWPPVLWTAAGAPIAALTWLAGARRAASALALMLALFFASTTEWHGLLRGPDAGARARFERARASGAALRVVSWNLAGFPLLDALVPLRPDLCLFQENAAPTAADRARSEWAGYTWSTGDDPAVWSRFPARVLPTESIGPWKPPLLLRVELPRGRALLVADVRLVLPAAVVAVAAVGGAHDLPLDHRRRVAQFERLAALLAQTARQQQLDTVVLCGDFNSPAGLPSTAPLRPSLRDAWLAAGIGWGATMGSDLPVSRIDQCWVSPNVEVVEARVERGPSSDHRFLWTDLIVP